MGSKPPAGSVFLGVTTAQRGCFLAGLITLHFAPPDSFSVAAPESKLPGRRKQL